MDLFDHALNERLAREAPLAARMRPRSLEEFVGQEHIVGHGKLLRRAIESGRLPSSLILWGPPGNGKTTLAFIIANSTHSHFTTISAVLAGVRELRRVIQEARERRKLHDQSTILFVDEVHRWNKAQQDALLPHTEQGIITLIGATTENPHFEVIAPLISRSRIFQLHALQDDEIRSIIETALTDEVRGFGDRQVRHGREDQGVPQRGDRQGPGAAGETPPRGDHGRAGGAPRSTDPSEKNQVSIPAKEMDAGAAQRVS